jgi:hypothetical protein
MLLEQIDAVVDIGYLRGAVAAIANVAAIGNSQLTIDHWHCFLTIVFNALID